MTINFYLDSKENKDGEKNVYCFVRGINKSKTIYLKTGIRLKPKFWNSNKQEVKRSFQGHSDINTYFSKIRTEIQRLYSSYKSNARTFDFYEFKKLVIKMLNPETEQSKKFFDVYDHFLEMRKNELSKGSLTKFKTIRKHLENFQYNKKYNLSFDSINQDFFDRFTAYQMNDLNHTNNTIHKTNGIFKSFMNWATDRGFNKNLDYRKFKTKETETEIIYLTDEELNTLLDFDLNNERLANLRDVFCFACFTGQRFSDVSRIRPEDIKNGFWHLRTKKTRDLIQIPLSRQAKEVLSKYFDSDLKLPVISNQKSNTYLKELCKKAGINDIVYKVRYRGAKRLEEAHPKYELITTHTARRTFVTLSLEKGMRPETVMKITGHKDYKTMKKYIKITEKVVKQELERAWR
jgi:integrase